MTRSTGRADAIAVTIVDGTIDRLKAMTDCQLSGDDSELANVWDEVCVQVQGEQSFAWGAYLDTIRSILVPAVEAMEPTARHALWLETEGGWDWQDENKDQEGSLTFNADDLVEYLNGLVLTEAVDYENDNIRRFLDDNIDDSDDEEEDDEEDEDDEDAEDAEDSEDEREPSPAKR